MTLGPTQPLDSRLHYTLTCKSWTHVCAKHRATVATLTNLLKQSGPQVDKERPAPHMHELATNDKCERVVKREILDLAVNFPGQLCTHSIDFGVRATVAERNTTSVQKVVACALMGEEDKMKRHKGKALAMVVETFGEAGPGDREATQLGSTRLHSFG